MNVSSVGKSDFKNAFAVSVSKKLQHFIFSKDLVANVMYADKQHPGLPIEDDLFEGRQVRFHAEVPAIQQWGHAQFGIYTKYIQSVEEWDEFRAESGIILRFQ